MRLSEMHTDLMGAGAVSGTDLDRLSDKHSSAVDSHRNDMRARALAARQQYERQSARPADTVNLVPAYAGYQPAASAVADRNLSRNVQLAVKRLFDILASLGGLIVLGPMLITVALIIKATSRGPVFFRQKRTGYNNELFEILKFRSMYTDRCDMSGVAQTTSNDPRITPIGRILRKTNIDELPQLINVLLGDMSLIGPRPHVPGMLAAGMTYEELVDDYADRHMMRPGITGLAQANGFRGPTTEPEPAMMRAVLDLEYCREFSLWLDAKILVRTVISELKGGKGF